MPLLPPSLSKKDLQLRELKKRELRLNLKLRDRKKSKHKKLLRLKEKLLVKRF